MKMIHLNAKIISRGGEKPQSAVAFAAYRSGTKIYCEYDGEIKDFSRKGHVIYSEILLPEYALKEFADRSVLWNAVENFEKGSRAQLSREIEFSLPCELDVDERLKAAKKLAEFFRDKGMVVDMNLHNPDHENPNPHCHLMLTMRPFQKDGTFLEKKCWREYELDKNGQKIPTKKGNDYKSHKVYATDWDDKGNVEKWRALWADIETDFYRKNGYEITAEHRSFERQGIDLLPTIHMGAAVTAMERRDIKTQIGNMNREIKKINELIISSMENIERLTDKIAFFEKEKKSAGQEKENEAPAQEKKEDSLTAILMEWQKNRSAFIQDNNIRQRTDTKTGNIKNFSSMVSFLQSHKIETLEDLHRLAEETKKQRSNNIHNQRELNAKLKKMSNIVDIYQAYKPYAEYLKKYESLSGRQKQFYYDKNADKIETALSYRTGLKNMSDTDKLLPKTWKRELDGLKAESARIKHDLAENNAILGELAEIADKAAMVQRGKSKQNEILPNLGEQKRKEVIMAENKKYYFLKLKEDFFDQREIVVLEGSKDGVLYVNILLKLYLKSLQHNGKLLLNEITPLSAEMIALLTRHEVGTVERAMRAFMQLGLVEVLEDNIFYMPEIQEMTGKGSSDGERKARYRRQKAEENMLLLTDKNTDIGQNWDNVPPLSQFCPPEIRDKSIENRDKNLDKRESKEQGQFLREKGTLPRPYGKYGNVILTDRELETLKNDFPADYLSMIEHLSEYMEYSGRTYKNHLATMECWKRADLKKEQETGRGYSYNGSFKEGDSL